MGTKLTVGLIVEPENAKRLCDRLDMACEIARGNFEWVHDGQCTTFTAPRVLGDWNYRIAKAVLDGYKIGKLY